MKSAVSQQRALGSTSRQALPCIRRAHRTVTTCSAATPEGSCLIIGGTGRVGSSTAAALMKSFPKLKVVVGSRDESSYQAALARRPELKDAGFQAVDIMNAESVKKALAGHQLVIHAAGPFQQSKNFNVIEQAIAARVPYVDVCDDMHYAEALKAKFSGAAAAAGVPAIISAGIYPGTSNVMAAHILSIARKEYDQDWKYKEPAPGEGEDAKLLRYSYYTAGSGGAGPTILETSFLLAGEPVIIYKEGVRTELPPISNRREVDFGPGIGRKGVYLYNLPECESAYKHMKVPGVSARFGTDPFFWNWAMWLTARLVPRSFLNNREWVKAFAKLSDPLVRTVDKFAGEAVAMKIEIDFQGDKNSSGIFVHRKLSSSMGYSVGAFAQAVLKGQTQPGVWYPEEPEALADRREFLRFAATGCERFDLNRGAWALESEAVQVGGLIYW